MIYFDTIVAPATASGGALSLIRISGADALSICDKVFRSPSEKKLADKKGYTMSYGAVFSSDGRLLDDVVASVFRAPHSYTGEDMVEISCHGSRYITAEIVDLLISVGARAASPGEFTTRAFMAGKIDLSQAEAVADMISSHDRATHALAVTQMRGGYSADLTTLRDELLRLVSLLELELDFSEEDVVFADRSELATLLTKILTRTEDLIRSFALGNVIKEGIGVAIVGSPNSGKSTLLNTLLNEDRAMVSDVAGTTRDAIEECICLSGTQFRFIDTAGIRASDDVVEQMGIERTFKAIDKARIILYLYDVNKLLFSGKYASSFEGKTSLDDNEIAAAIDGEISAAIQNKFAYGSNGAESRRELCVLLNKCDLRSGFKSGSIDKCGSDGTDRSCCDGRNDTKCSSSNDFGAGVWQELAAKLERRMANNDARYNNRVRVIPVSAKYGHNIEELTDYLTTCVNSDPIYCGDTVVSNSRHYDALLKTNRALRQALAGLTGNRTAAIAAAISTKTTAATEMTKGASVVSISGGSDKSATDAGSFLTGASKRMAGVYDKPMADAAITPLAAIPPIVEQGGVSTDLIAQDVREALHWLGTITGEITSDEILSNIFSKFCIGK